MCCNCMLTLRERYWKTDSQWETGITSLATCRSVLKICRLIPGPSQSQRQLPCSSGSVPSSLGNVLWQSLSSLLVTSALTIVSWLLSVGVALYSLLKHCIALPFPTCCIFELCCPPVASTLQAHPNSAAWLSPPQFLSTALRMWCSFAAVSTMLSLLTCFDARLPEALLCHLSSKDCHPSIYQFKRKVKKKEVAFS